MSVCEREDKGNGQLEYAFSALWQYAIIRCSAKGEAKKIRAERRRNADRRLPKGENPMVPQRFSNGAQTGPKPHCQKISVAT